MKRFLSAFLILGLILCSFSACSSADKYVEGTTTENTYKSEFLNLGYNLPDGHTFADEAAKKAFKDGVTAQMENAEEEANNSAMICDMISENEGKTEQITVTLEKKTDEQMATTPEMLKESTSDKLYKECSKITQDFFLLDVPETEMNLGGLFGFDLIIPTSKSSFVVRRLIVLDQGAYYTNITLTAESHERMAELTGSFYRLTEVE